MSFQEISDRLTALQESNAQLKELIDRLANIKFQPGSVPLGQEEPSVKAELASEIQQTIKDQEEDLDILQEDIYDIYPPREGSEEQLRRDRLDRNCKKAIAELKELVPSFRRAQLSASKTLQEAQRLERQLLVKSYENPRPANGLAATQNQERKELSREDKTVNASTDVTLALRRTHDMMASELSRSQFAHDTLKESTQALADLGETYSTLDTLLSSSKNLLGTLLRSQKSDTWYLETAFYILVATIGWLIFRRFLYGPAWWFVWFPLRIFFRSWIGILTAMGVLGGSKTDVSVGSGGGTTELEGSLDQIVVSSGTPSVFIGHGDSGSPERQTDTPHDETLSDQVGRIIDESQEQVPTEEQNGGTAASTEGEEEPAEAERNPKKRMWEDVKEAPKEEQRIKDEL